MKIFSKFKDYYDHIQQFGQGDDVSYIRNTEKYCKYHEYASSGKWYKMERPEDSLSDVPTVQYDMKHPIESLGGFIKIYFCGKVYYALQTHQTVAKDDGKIIPGQFFYDPDKYHKHYEAIDYKYSSRSDLKTIMRNLSDNGTETSDMNVKVGCPVIMVCHNNWPNGLYNIYNPRLYEIEFQKIVDPYTAYMELDMFISGVLGKTGGEMVTISDKDKIDKHGFDAKYGFRNRPKESA